MPPDHVTIDVRRELMRDLREARDRALRHGLRGRWVRAWLWTVWGDALEMELDEVGSDDAA